MQRRTTSVAGVTAVPRLAIMLVVLILALAACGGTGQGASPGDATNAASSRELTEVVIRMPFLMSGYDAPFFLGLERGFYEEEGLNVKIEEGQGSQTTAQTVANQQDDYGFADAATAATLIAKGAPLKVIAVMQQQGSHAFIYQPPVEINGVEDLEGTTLISDGSAPFALLPAVLDRNSDGEIAVEDLEHVVVESSSYQQSFLTTERGVLLGNIYSTYQSILREAPDTQALLYSELGVNTLGMGMMTSTEKIESNPDEVMAVMRAVTRAWEASVEDPQAAVDALIEAYPELDPDVSRAQLDQFLELRQTDNSEGQPLGWTAPEDWELTLELLRNYMELDGDRPVDEFYTNDFVPGS